VLVLMRDMGLESKFGKMVRDMLATGKITWLTEKGNFTIPTVVYLTENGGRIKRMALGC